MPDSFTIKFFNIFKQPNQYIAYARQFIDLINTDKTILLKENKNFFNLFFSKVLDKKINLYNYEDYKNVCSYVLDNKTNNKPKDLFVLLLMFSIIPSILYTDENELQNDRKYTIKILNYLHKIIKKLTYTFNRNDGMYINMTQICSDFSTNYTYFFAYHGSNNVKIYSLISDIFILLLPKNFIFDLTVKKQTTNKILFIGNNIVKHHSIANTHSMFVKHMIEDPSFDVKILTYGEIEQMNYFVDDLDNHIINFKDIYTDKNIIETIAHFIANENFNVIIYTEIGMDPLFRFLSFYRLANVQINTYGHSETSGIPTINYYISSKYYENINSPDNYSEKLIQFDSLCTYYENPITKLYTTMKQYHFDAFKQVKKNKLCIKDHHVIYGCLQIYYKFHPSFLRTAREILKSNDNALFMLLDYGECSTKFKIYINSIGEEYKDRIIFIEKCNFDDYMQYMDICTVIIDNFNFGGCNTTMQALSLGKIVLTLSGKLLCNSFTQGYYQKIILNIQDDILHKCICNTEKELIDMAIFLGQNLQDIPHYQQLISDMANTYLFNDENSVIEWNNLIKTFINT
jgi:protein O-GlcNAc transferase